MNSSNDTDSPNTPPDPEVVAMAQRRRLSSAAKCLLLAEAERCKAAGTLGAFLRSAGIYPATLSSWRKQLGTLGLSQFGSPRRLRKRS